LEALIFCQEDILNYISENLFEKTPEQLSDPRFYSKEEILMKYSRFIVTSIYTLIYLLGILIFFFFFFFFFFIKLLYYFFILLLLI